MLSAPLAPLLVWLLTGTAPPSSSQACEQDRRRIELTQTSPHDFQEVCISAGFVTTLLFDSRIHAEQIELEAMEDFTEVEASGRLLLLVPSSRLEAGRRLRLSVKFEDGEAPAGATFILVVDPLRAERQVEVVRPRRALEACRRELDVVSVRTRQLQLELEHLRARVVQERNLERAALSEMENEGKLIVRNLSKDVTWDEKAVLALKLISYRAVRTKGSMLLQVELTLPRSAQPWRINDLTLSASGMTKQRYTRIWQAPTLANDGLYFLLTCEVEMDEPSALHELVLTTQGGQALTIGNISIP
ncbi:DUF2381 family protein [Archangium lipolyticum]|uniref:DUF2381 family protein n=1 Tax=Archangium lipolyticum TaxID=2970465 RepID=UPI002149A620|nr:DUF2381 family protein [Archangium lipolyticum]